MTFAFTLNAQAGTGKIIEAELTGNYVGSGLLQYQYPLTVFNSTSVSGSYVFSLETPTGTGSSGVHHGAVGRLDLSRVRARRLARSQTPALWMTTAVIQPKT